VSEKEKLIEKVLSIELNMFLKVPAEHPTICQENREGFRLVRGSVFETWSEKTLASYLNDLFGALRKGINLMTQKYARMDDLIPPLNDNPLIDKIVEIEEKWQAEVRNKYPNIIKQQSSRFTGDQRHVFAKYLRSELETYSDQTLNSYYEDLKDALEKGKNLSEERYSIMFKRLGYSSLEEVNSLSGKQDE